MKKFNRLVEDAYASMYMTEGINFEDEINDLKSELEYLDFKEVKGKDCLIKMKYKKIIVELFEQSGQLYFYIDGKGNGTTVEMDGEYDFEVIKSYLDEMM